MARVRAIFFGGALALCAGWIAGAAGPSLSRAQAQDTKLITSSSRYQLETYAAPGSAGDVRVTYGAYVLDTETGELFHVSGKQKPTRVGTVLDAR